MFVVIQGDKLVGRKKSYFGNYVAHPDFGRDLRNAETGMDDSERNPDSTALAVVESFDPYRVFRG